MGKEFGFDFDLSTDDLYNTIDQSSNQWEETVDGKPTTIIGPDCKKSWKGIERFVQAIAVSNRMAFSFGHQTGRSLARELEPLAGYFDSLRAFIGDYDPAYEYSVNVSLFYQTCQAMGLMELPMLGKPAAWIGNKREGEIFNDLIARIRIQVRGPEVQAAKRKKYLYCKRNIASLRDYVDRLFSRHARLLVMRVDFGYGMQHSAHVSVEQAQRDMQKLLGNRRHNRLFQTMRGYVWKLEYANLKGFHFHVIFFFDASQSRQYAYLTDKIGEYWKTVITQGKGEFHNCCRDKKKYTFWAMGEVRNDDEVMRRNLLVALRYFAKRDLLLKSKALSNVRVMGKGEALLSPGIRLGRPRRQVVGLGVYGEMGGANV